MMHIILLLSICVALNHARCPDPAELPKKCNDTHLMCARLYDESSHVDSLSCGGKYIDVCNGSMTYWNDWWNDRVSALVVSDGCKLDAYVEGGYGGNRNQYTGKHSQLYEGWGYSISSWVCNCSFSNAVLGCEPREEYQLITTCQNSSPGPVECTVGAKEGMSLGNSVTRGRTLSHSAEVSIGAVFKDMFSVGLSASTTTEYSWSESSSQTFDTVKNTSATCSVPGGSTVKVLQVVGKCGDTVVYTNHFICQ